MIIWFSHRYLKQCVQSKVVYRDNKYKKCVILYMIAKTTNMGLACRHTEQ